jgi:hypothetical protein
MTTSTSLLGLALPGTGELAGTWGTTVNTSVTSLIDSAVAGTTTLSADADVTLTDDLYIANEARQAILRWTASNGATTRNITAPARSKAYIVINAGTGPVVLRGAGPTTGVTIAPGDKCVAAWNGSDFVKVAAESAVLVGKTISVDDNTISGIAASSFVLSNGSGNIDGAAAQKVIPAGVVVGTTDTQTLTNKRITARVNAQTTTTSPWAWNSNSFDQQSFSALANALTINADAGTPTDGQKTVFRFKDNGTARALTWTTGTTNSFRVMGGSLPSSTVAGKTIYVGCIYNALDSRWDAVAYTQEA